MFIPLWVFVVFYEGFVWWLFLIWNGTRPRRGRYGAWLWLAAIGLLAAVFTILLATELDKPESALFLLVMR